MSFDWITRKDGDIPPKYSRSIIFQERHQERIFNASDDRCLSESCLILLRERYLNPIWGYRPEQKDITEEERDFLEFYKTDHYMLPALMLRAADGIKRRIESRLDVTSDPDWTWYSSVESLLELSPEVAVDYKIPYKGRLIPTSYFLLIQRRSNPNEGFVLVDSIQN